MRASRAARVVAAVAAAALLWVANPADATLPALPATQSSNVNVLGTLPDPGAVAGRVLGDTMYVTTVAGVRTYDVSDPANPVQLGSLTLPHCCNEDVDTNGKILLVAADHVLGFPSVLYVLDVRDRAAPTLLSQLDFSETGAHTATCIKRDCSYAWVAGSSHVSVVDLRKPATPKEVARFYADGTKSDKKGDFGTSHDVNLDHNGIAWVSAQSGFYGYDPKDPLRPTLVASLPNEAKRSFENDYIVHNSLRPHAPSVTKATMADDDIDRGEVLYVTEEDWLATYNQGCQDEGRFQTGWVHRVRGRVVVERLDSIRLGAGGDPATQQPTAATCSAHYFSLSRGVAAVGWYEQGVRFFDVSDPRDIRQIGYYVPEGDVWSTLYHRGYHYVFDNVRGIDVLRFGGKAGGAAVASPALRASSRPVRGVPGFGLACRVPVLDTPGGVG